MRKNLYLIILLPFFFYSCVKNSEKDLIQQASVEGVYVDSGLFVGVGFFADTATIIAIDSNIYETHFPQIKADGSDSGFKNWKFTFSIDSSGHLINWHAEGNTYVEPQSNFMTVVNPTNDPNFPGAPYTDPPYSNVYDPSTKTIWMHYGYGSGASNENTYSREIFEKFVKQ